MLISNPHFSCFNLNLQMYNIPAITFKVHKPYQVFKETGAFKGYSPQTLLRNLGKKKKKGFPKVSSIVLFYGSDVTLFTNDHCLSKAYVKKRFITHFQNHLCHVTVVEVWRFFHVYLV